jgi:hypothetical protein
MIYSNEVVKTKMEYPLSLAMVKNHLNVEDDFTEDDAYILSLIKAATNFAEDYTGIDIALTENVKDFYNYEVLCLTINEAPFRSVVAVRVVVDGVESLLVENTDFTVKIDAISFTIMFNEAIVTEKISVVFYTGYECLSVPPVVAQAITVKVNDLYDIERTSNTVGVNYRSTMAFQNLLGGHVIDRWV